MFYINGNGKYQNWHKWVASRWKFPYVNHDVRRMKALSFSGKEKTNSS